jgi:hypothetical protein
MVLYSLFLFPLISPLMSTHVLLGLVDLKLIPAIKEMLRVNGTCDANGTSLFESTLHVH